MHSDLAIGVRIFMLASLFGLTMSGVRANNESSVVEAAKQQDIATVRVLLRDGGDVNAPQGDGATALHWAAHWDDLAMAEQLLHAGARVDAANDLGVTPLSLACTNGSQAMIARLLKAGADPNASAAGRASAVMVAAWTGNAGVMKLLLGHGGDVSATEGSKGQTALMWAASEGHSDVVRLLVERGADVDARTHESDPTQSKAFRFAPDGRFTALMFAARAGSLESARTLLDAGASPNDTSSYGLSPLVLATVRGYPDVATLLLDRGADPNADGDGYTALHWAAGSWETELTTRAITTNRAGEWYTLAGLREGKLDLVKALLAHGADPNARVTDSPLRVGSSWNRRLPELRGATPLFIAALAGEADVMRVLVANGADVGLTSKMGGTVLMGAAGLGRVRGEVIVPESETLAAARLALDLGADVNAIDAIGNSALHYAAYQRRDATIQFLVEQGAALDGQNQYEEMPLWVAQLIIQPGGGGIFELEPSSSADLLRMLGAPMSEPPYAPSRTRPADWPNIPACPPTCQ